MVQDPNFLKKLEEYMNKVKAEATYFFEADGNRVAAFIVDMQSADQIPVLTEPLFNAMGAHVELHPVMWVDDVMVHARVFHTIAVIVIINLLYCWWQDKSSVYFYTMTKLFAYCSSRLHFLNISYSTRIFDKVLFERSISLMTLARNK